MATVEKINQKSREVMTRKAVTTSGRKLEKSEIESHRWSGPSVEVVISYSSDLF